MTAQSNRPTPHLVLGGAKSGKSIFAERLITALPPPYIYVATAQALDEEMRERILRHRERRKGSWETVESPLHLVPVLNGLKGKGMPVLVDCISLWLTNLLLHQDAPDPEEALQELCALVPTVDYPLFFVSNEVGSGIVPENALARRFRDLSGAANQRLADISRSVTLVVAGIPLTLK